MTFYILSLKNVIRMDTCTYIWATFQIKVSLFNVVFGENVGIIVIMLVKNRQNSEVFFFFPSSLIENDRKKRIVYCIYQQVPIHPIKQSFYNEA